MKNLVLSAVSVVFLISSLDAPAAAQQRPLTVADYGRWEELGAATLSPNGEWLVYRITRNNERNELRILSLANDSVWVIPFGAGPEFSKDGRWLAYRIEPSEEEKAELEKEEKPVRNSLGLFQVATRDTLVVPEVASFAFSHEEAFLVMEKYKSEEAETEGLGSDLVVRNLDSAVDISFGNVSAFAWSDQGHLLAMTLSTASGAGNGVQLFDPSTGSLHTLDSRNVRYSNLSWRKDADDLAVLRAEPDTLHEDTAQVVLAWKRLGEGRRETLMYDPAGDPDFPEDSRIVEYRTPVWSDDGATIFFGIQVRKPVSEKHISVRDSATVEVWHAGDARVIPHQKKIDQRLREENLLTAWPLDSGRTVRLGDGLTDVRLMEGQQFALGIDERPYEAYGRFFPTPQDLYSINVTTGARTRIQERVLSFYTSSGGRYVMYVEDEEYWTYDVQSGERALISGEVTTPLVNMEDDHPRPERFPYGFAGWSEGDSSVIVYDRYDLWELRSDGSGARRLTRGAEEEVRHRYARLDPEEEYIDLSSPLYLSVFGQVTKKDGYARLQPGQAVERLVWLDKSVFRLQKAKQSSVYVYAVEAYDDSPDYFVGDASLADARKVTETNPFQSEYSWGRTELLELDNPVNDARLQGVLIYPAGYEPGEQYPMVVYIYERLSDRLHGYRRPSERSTYNPTVFSSQGYFVFMPDIAFQARDPGFSALQCVEAAVEKVLGTGMVDPKRVGIMGHSWGGYETTFIAAHSDMLAAAVAGAPLTNLVSMYGMIFWNTGIPETGHYEYGQERMEVPLWEDSEAYLRNSPVMAFDRLEVPLLMAFGDEDGSVDWHQGIEAYNFARRLDKNFVLLVYRGENHSNRQKPNQVDYHHRQLEWFDYYLKGAEAPAWITLGVSWIEQEARRESK